MNNKKTLEQIPSIYGFKVFRFLKDKHLSDSQIERIIINLYNFVQYNKYREHFRTFPNELLDK